MFRAKFSDFKITPYFLKEKKFWFFFFFQFLLWMVFYFWQVSEIVNLTFLNAGQPQPSFSFHLINCLLVGLPIFGTQILSAAIIPKTDFWRVAAIVLLCYLKTFGFLIALIWFLFDRVKPKKIFEKIILFISAFALFNILLAPLILLYLYFVDAFYVFLLF